MGICAAIASWFATGGGNPFEDKKRKIKEQVRSQFNSNLCDFSKNIAEQYNKSVQQICRDMQTEVDERIGEMNDQLPTDVLPETATINALIYNEKPELEIIMQDGSIEHGQVERSFLERFSAKNQTEECSKIKYLKIGYPFRLLNKNVVIVDTPGVSDLNEQRCDVTYNFIPKANAVLFLLDANSPLKKSEIDFIEEKLLAQGIDNIIFLVNKYDNVDEEEEDDFWEHLQLHMLKAFADSEYKLKSLNMYPLSAWQPFRFYSAASLRIN